MWVQNRWHNISQSIQGTNVAKCFSTLNPPTGFGTCFITSLTAPPVGSPSEPRHPDFPLNPVNRSRLHLHPRVPLRENIEKQPKNDINLPIISFFKWWIFICPLDEKWWILPSVFINNPMRFNGGLTKIFTKSKDFREPHLLAAAMPLAICAVGTTDLAWKNASLVFQNGVPSAKSC